MQNLKREMSKSHCEMCFGSVLVKNILARSKADVQSTLVSFNFIEK